LLCTPPGGAGRALSPLTETEPAGWFGYIMVQSQEHAPAGAVLAEPSMRSRPPCSALCCAGAGTIPVSLVTRILARCGQAGIGG
jgi:hypothetical protein